MSIVVLLWLVSEVTIAARAGRRVGARTHDRLSRPALAIGVALAVWLGVVFARTVRWAAITGARPVAIAAGVVVALVGIAVRQYAVASLGRYFTTHVMTSPDQKVVETGPYHYIRHPSYTGLLLTVLGVLLTLGNWISLACFVIALPGFAYRMKVEEGALSEALGEAYRDYMRRTKRLVPYIV
jgi:protein-S-isoprenylcysteine O-methyltransferase Ste14